MNQGCSRAPGAGEAQQEVRWRGWDGPAVQTWDGPAVQTWAQTCLDGAPRAAVARLLGLGVVEAAQGVGLWTTLVWVISTGIFWHSLWKLWLVFLGALICSAHALVP